jgi:hypothetical protein
MKATIDLRSDYLPLPHALYGSPTLPPVLFLVAIHDTPFGAYRSILISFFCEGPNIALSYAYRWRTACNPHRKIFRASFEEGIGGYVICSSMNTTL